MYGVGLVLLGLAGRTDIHDDKQDEDREEDEGEEGTQFGCESSLARIGIDKGRERLESVASFGEEGDAEVVDTECDTEYESANHAGP